MSVEPYTASAGTRAACGLRALQRVATVSMPYGGKEYRYVTPSGRTIALTVPPASFDAAMASPQELETFGVPPEPAHDSAEYPKWKSMIEQGIHFVAAPASLVQATPSLRAGSPLAPSGLAAAAAIGSAPTGNSTGNSNNWAGYFNWGGHGSFTHTTAYVLEPHNYHNSCGESDASSTWGGIGGTPYNPNLAQDGTDQGTPGLGENAAWFEVLPEPEEPSVPPIHATPGSWFEADTQYKGKGEFSFYLYNFKTHEAARGIADGGFEGNVADFILERKSPYNLTNVGTVSFQGFTNGKAFGQDSTQRIVMRNNQTHETNATPSGISSKYAFTVKYEHCPGAGAGGSGQGPEEGPLPSVATNAATGVSEGAATLNGTVNPEGFETTYSFEYGTEAGNFSASTPETEEGSGKSTVPVSSAISGLAPGTTYHYRIIAYSPTGTSVGAEQTFTTTGTPPPPPPTATTEGASAITASTATLSASVNPNGADTHYYIEYGTTPALFEATAPAPPGSDVGAGTTPVHATAELSGLSPFTTYYYRVVASSSSGTTYGQEKSFKTNAWTIQTTANPGGEPGAELTDVACASATSCMAVGRDSSGSGTSTSLAERWNGTAWEIIATPNPTGAKESILEGVACSSASTCIAVGRYEPKKLPSRAFSETWNGTSWKLETTPEPQGASTSWLNSVACSSASACTAVGTYETSKSGPNLAMAERWNGSSWTVQSVPVPPGAAETTLGSVSCPSSTLCIAVGSERGVATLAESWNGKAWTVQTTPNVAGATTTYLTGVSCASSSECMAVGYSWANKIHMTLAERWTGTTWTIVPTPNPEGANASYLYGVSCASSTCTAVGDYWLSESGPIQLAAQRWNGSAWELEPPLAPEAGGYGLLNDVSCSASTTCTAVGWYATPTGQGYTLAERSVLNSE